MIRILLVDDNQVVRRYLRAILEQGRSWRVCGEVGTGAEVIRRVHEIAPDLVLLDFHMPDLNGLEVARQIRASSPEMPILMVTLHMSNQLASAARVVGIQGVCAKSDVGSIVEAVQALLEERTYFPQENIAEPEVKPVLSQRETAEYSIPCIRE